MDFFPPGLIVKFKKMRTSELRRLNNEAENFLFPPTRDEIETDEDIDNNAPNTTVSTYKGDSTLLLSSEPENIPNVKKTKPKNENTKITDNFSELTKSKKKQTGSYITNNVRKRKQNIPFDNSPIKKKRRSSVENNIVQDKKQKRASSVESNCSTDTQGSKKRKRLSHVEAFILDNQKYYKFETPGTRLRYHGSLLTSGKSPQKNNGDCVQKNNNNEKKEKSEDVLNQEVISKDVKFDFEELQFSFERVPKSEPWYQTFQRQDRGEVFYSSTSESSYFWKPLLLPYEMGPIPPLDPRICICTYQQVKKKILEPISAAVDTKDSEHVCSEGDIDVQEDSSKESESSNFTVETKGSDDTDDKPLITLNDKLKRKRGGNVGKNPRKSPRQHASTLAILSSLIHQRKRKSRSISASPNKSNLSTIVEDEDSNSQNVLLEEKLKTIDLEGLPEDQKEIYSVTLDKSDELEIMVHPEISFHSELDAIELLKEHDLKHKEEMKKSLKTNLKKMIFATGPNSPGRRKLNRKKKKNKTGWPKTNRKNNKRDVEEKDECSITDSLSLNADSEDEVCSGTVEVSNTANINDKTEVKNKTDEQCLNKSDQSNISVNNEQVTSVQKNINGGNSGKKTVSEKEDRVMNKNNKSATEVNEHKSDRVVDLEQWENAEKVLTAKLSNETMNKDLQPFVIVKKLDSDPSLKNKRQSCNSPPSAQRTNTKQSKNSPITQKSPRALRKPRGRWYRER